MLLPTRRPFHLTNWQISSGALDQRKFYRCVVYVQSGTRRSRIPLSLLKSSSSSIFLCLFISCLSIALEPLDMWGLLVQMTVIPLLTSTKSNYSLPFHTSSSACLVSLCCTKVGSSGATAAFVAMGPPYLDWDDQLSQAEI